MPTSYDVRLLRRKEIAEGTMEFTLEKPPGFEYRAGQYGDLVLPPSTGLDDSNNKHGFSFVSAPFENTLRMATRMRDSRYKSSRPGSRRNHGAVACVVGRFHTAKE